MNDAKHPETNVHQRDIKKYLAFVGMLVLIPIAGLWSWNTIADLAGIPLIQYKHAVAGMVFILSVSWLIKGKRRSFHNHS